MNFSKGKVCFCIQKEYFRVSDVRQSEGRRKRAKKNPVDSQRSSSLYEEKGVAREKNKNTCL